MRDFNHSVNVLVKAYMNDTLEHGKCDACAVANLLQERADNIGIKRSRWANKFVTVPSGSNRGFYHLVTREDEIISAGFMGLSVIKIRTQDDLRVHREAMRLLTGADYTIAEYTTIENAFETARNFDDKDADMFNGLMAVVDVLADIHKIDLTQREESKKLFVKV